MACGASILAFSLVLALSAAGSAAAGPPGSDAPPVAVSVAVQPSAVSAGSDAQVTITLRPNAGIKLNKYPKIKVQVPATAGLVAAAEGAIGNAAPPSPDHLDANYYKGGVDPLVVTLHVDKSAAAGAHEVPAKLTYFYCVTASGYCAPAKVDVALPLTVR
jgi:ABC-type phosphate transport system substrate-binding protein